MADLLFSGTRAASFRGTTEQHIKLSHACGLADVWHPVLQASAFVMLPVVAWLMSGILLCRRQHL